MDGDLTVLYVAGAGRSGSTLVDRVIGSHPRALSLNEVNRVWARGVLADDVCGCGEPFRSCPFWREVFREAFGGWDEDRARRMAELQGEIERTRHFPRAWLARLTGGLGRGDYRTYRESLTRLYFAVRDVSGRRVLVDSSKRPTIPLIMSAAEEIDLRVVHLVRDARGSVHSAVKRRKYDPGTGEPMEGRSVAVASIRWIGGNLFAEALGRLYPYHRIRYEDFTTDPTAAVGDLLSGLAGLDPAGVPFVDERTVRLGEVHSAGGNPQRFERGEVEIRRGESWPEKTDRAFRLRVRSVCEPLLRSYGYE